MSVSRAKVITIAAALVAASAVPAYALFGVGDIVFDPTQYGWHLEHESRELIHWAEEIKKFEDFVSSQLKTIESLTDLKNGINSRLGDWQGVYDRAVNLRNRAENLKATLGANFSVVATVDIGTPALVYTNHGAYAPLKLTNGFGSSFSYPDDGLKRYNAVYRAHQDWFDSNEQAEKEIPGLLTDIADTSKEIVGATDQEKLAKLQEKKSTLVLRLQELQRQLDQKVKLLTAQATLNETRAAMERDVQREKLKQTFQEARDRDAANVTK